MLNNSPATLSANDSDTTPRRGRLKRVFLPAAAIILAVFLLLGFLEGTLRLTGYGYPTSYFQESTFEHERWVSVNDAFPLRFFPYHRAFPPFHVRFKAKKPAGAFRCFILGESAAMGYPSPEASFWRILSVTLEQRFPGKQIEIINCANPAINSHAILPIARECARYSPDLFVVFMGNNEFLGPFGPCNVDGTFPPSLPLIRLQLAVGTTRLGQFAQAMAAHMGSLRGKTPDPYAFLGMRPDDPRSERVYVAYQRNLDDICRIARQARAETIVATVPCNLKDWPPLGSAHRPGLSAAEQARWQETFERGVTSETQAQFSQALIAYSEAAAIDDVAELQYRIGECRYATQEYAAARENLQRSRDREMLRSTMDLTLYTMTRDTALQYKQDGVVLADCIAAFADLAPNHITDHTLFYDNVHLTFEGNYGVAATLAPIVAGIVQRGLQTAPTPGVGMPSVEEAKELLAYTPWHEQRARQIIADTVRKASAIAQIGDIPLTPLSRRPIDQFVLTAQLPLSTEELQRDIAAVRAHIDHTPMDFLQRDCLRAMEQELAGNAPGTMGIPQPPVPSSTP